MSKVNVKQTLVGVVSWCDIDKFPERWSTFKRMVRSLEKFLPREEVITAVVDNYSSQEVQQFIENANIFDIKVMLPENIQDVGAYGILGQIAVDKKLPYLWILENDYVLFKRVPLTSVLQFLVKHPEVGYIRMQKFIYTSQKYFDKARKNEGSVDKRNAVWLKNIETGKELGWSAPMNVNNEIFYINNWHFGLHGGLIKTHTWKKLYPDITSQMPYYYKFETLMRKNYQRLNLQTVVLDGGVFSMSAPSVYQAIKPLPLVSTISHLLRGPQGGYIDGQIVSHYRQNYKNYFPVQIQLFSNSLGVEEISNLKDVFASRWLGYGPKSKEFEAKFAELLGAKYALGISSCTSGLFMSTEMLGIGIGDEVIMPSVSFIGCANAVIKAGAKPVFADVDGKYFNILPSEIARLLNRKTKAVIILHYGGIPAPVREIKRILKKVPHKVYLIEDSANSIKSLYHGKYSGTLGDIGLFSLDANKVITTGTGGILTTNDDELYQKARVMRFYGLKPETASGYDALRARKERWWEIDLEYHGNRYLINDITSTIALAQLPKLDQFIKARKLVWDYYQRHFHRIKGITTPADPPVGTTSSYYFYWVQVRGAREQLSLARSLVKSGIYTTFRYFPLHLIDYYGSKVRLPISESIANTTLNLPLHHNLKQRDLERIVSTVKQWADNQLT